MLDAMQVFAQTLNVPDIDIVGIGAIILALGAIVVGARAVNKTLKKANQFFDDWYGDKENGKDGVIHRLNALETNQGDIKCEVSEIKETVSTQLFRNGGSTMADAAFGAYAAVQDLQLQVEEEVKERKNWQDRYDSDQLNTRREWTSVFKAIRQMIPLSDPNEQLALWDTITDKYTKGEL